MCNQQTKAPITKNSSDVQNIKEKAIINIIADSVIFSRVSSSMRDIVNAINPSLRELHFEPYLRYNGVSNAIDLMGITDMKDANFRDELREEFTTLVFEVEKELDAKDVATKVYYSWLTMIREYFTTIKKVA